jgi:hypothetical protein
MGQLPGAGVAGPLVDADGMPQVIKDEVGDFDPPLDELLWLVGN